MSPLAWCVLDLSEGSRGEEKYRQSWAEGLAHCESAHSQHKHKGGIGEEEGEGMKRRNREGRVIKKEGKREEREGEGREGERVKKKVTITC